MNNSLSENTEPAFPVFDSEHYPQYRGMTLRDYFAAKAMAAMLSIKDIYENTHEKQVALGAYAQADAMIEARKKVV